MNIKMSDRLTRLDWLCIFTLIAGLLYVLIKISFYGNPLADESLPFATAMRFLQGQKPFVDDLSPLIPLGILMTPLVKLSLLVHHGKNELILFLRHSYIIFQLATGTYVFLATKKYLPTFLAFFCGIVIALYHSFGINNFHYDTLATTLWSAVILQFFNLQTSNQNNFRDYLLFSIINILLLFVYPTFIAFLLPLYLIFSYYVPNRKLFWSLHFSVGGLVGLILALVIFIGFKVNLTDIANTLTFNKNLFQLYAGNHGFFYKYVVVVTNVFAEYWHYVLMATAILFLGKLNQRLLLLSIPAVIALPFWNMSSQEMVFRQTFYFINCVGFLAPLIYAFFLKENELAQTLFYRVWIPILCAGLLTASSSSNHAMNFNVGFFPAFILSFIFLYLLLEKQLTNFIRLKYFATRGTLITGIVIVGYFQMHYIYGATRIGMSEYHAAKRYKHAGPFKNIYFDSDWSDHVNEIETAIKSLDTDTNKYIYFGPLSGGYLLVENLKPGEALLFCPYQIKHINAPVKYPNYVFFDETYNSSPYGTEIAYMKDADYQKVLTNKFFTIYQANQGNPGA